jgi:hypothetical protein
MTYRFVTPAAAKAANGLTVRDLPGTDRAGTRIARLVACGAITATDHVARALTPAALGDHHA